MMFWQFQIRDNKQKDQEKPHAKGQTVQAVRQGQQECNYHKKQMVQYKSDNIHN